MTKITKESHFSSQRAIIIFISLLCLIIVNRSTAMPVQAITVASESLFVALTGSDLDSGTALHPWRTIQKACDAAPAGSVVFIRKGIYNEKCIMHVAGDAVSGPILFQNFGNDSVVIDGTNIAGDQLLLIKDRRYISIAGIEFRNNLNQTFGAGIWVQGYGDHITIRRNWLHDMRAAAGGGDAMAISVYGTSDTSLSHIVIDSNLIENCQPGHSESVALNGNVDTFLVADNIVRDVNNIGIVMIGGEKTCPTPARDQARNGLCRGNIVYRARSGYGGGYAAGIYVDGGGNITVERNTVFECDLGIEIGCENHGRIASGMIVRDNLLFNNDKRGLSFGGYNYPVTGTVTACSFTNNTCYHNDVLNSGDGELTIEHAEQCTVENNIFYSTGQNRLLTCSSGVAGNVLDYNIWYAPGGAPAATVDYNGNVYTGYSSYVGGALQDVHSSFGDPLFSSLVLPKPDLRIQTGSPALNAGDPAYLPPSGEVDFAGHPRLIGGRVDCGAYEGMLNLPDPPQLLDPADNAVVAFSSIILRWAKSGGANSYDLQIGNDSLFGTLLMEDSLASDTVQTAGPLVNGFTYFWRVRAKGGDGYGAWSGVRRFRYQIQSRWSLISLPVHVADPAVKALYPAALSPAFAYQPGGGYATRDSLAPGVGYWIKFADNRPVTISGDSLVVDTINVIAGWNLIGSISSPVAVSAINSDPPAMTVSVFFGYDGGYTIDDTIRPGTGHWVKCASDGLLILQKGGGPIVSRSVKIVPTSELPPPPPGDDRRQTAGLPRTTALEQNYPNPFNSSTIVRFRIARPGFCVLKIYSLTGAEVAELISGELSAGDYSLTWEAGRRASGVYYCRLSAPDGVVIRKLLLMK